MIIRKRERANGLLLFAIATFVRPCHTYSRKFLSLSHDAVKMAAGNIEHADVDDNSSNMGVIGKEDTFCKPQQIAKVHTTTVCMVPPPENNHVWEIVSKMRRDLRDPGYYRWPPHVNLLYPFLPLHTKEVPVDGTNVIDDYSKNDNDSSILTLKHIVHKLESTIKTITPFTVCLNTFGTFGGKKRGVLWLHPESYWKDIVPSESLYPPLNHLQQCLEDAFPMCRDQSQKGDGAVFVPHMTVSHFPNLEEALQAQKRIEESYDLTEIHFLVDRVYVLERKGDGGQFLRVAEIVLGGGGGTKTPAVTRVFDPPEPFPAMVREEEDWVYDERMKMKSRRKNGNIGPRNSGRRGRRSGPRLLDTPEVIAIKRAARKAKKERSLMEEEEKDKSWHD